MTFTVTHAPQEGDVTRLRLSGELDMSTAGELNDTIDRLLAAGRSRLLVDLAELTFCDSTGIAALLRGDNNSAAAGGWVRLTGANGRVERVLQITGLADVLRHTPVPGDPTTPVRR